MIVNIRFGEFSIRILVSRSLVPKISPWTFCFLTLTWLLGPLELVFNSDKNNKSVMKFAEMASVLEYIFWTQYLWTTRTIVTKIWTLVFVCANFWVRLFINFKETKWTRCRIYELSEGAVQYSVLRWTARTRTGSGSELVNWARSRLIRRWQADTLSTPSRTKRRGDPPYALST